MNEALFARRLKASGLWAAAGRILSGVFLLLLHGVLARGLSGGDYGRYVLIESIALLLCTVCLAGVPAVVLRMIKAKLVADDEAGASEVVFSAFALLTGTSLLTVGATIAISQLSDQSLPGGLSWQWMPWFTGWAFLATGLRLLSEVYRGYDRYSWAYCVGGQSGGLAVNALLLTCSVIGIASGQMSLHAMMTIQIVVQLFFLAMSSAELGRQLTGVPKRPTSTSVRLLFLSAWPLLVAQLVSVGLPEIGKLVLGAYSTPEDTGLYNAAIRLVILAHVPLMVVNNAIQPFVAELYSAGDRRRLVILVRGSATLAAIPSVAVLGTFLFFPEPVLELVFGAKFIAAAPALQILSLGSLAWVLSGSCGLVLMMTGHERSCMIGTLIPGIAYLLLCPVVIKVYGVNGAAACSTALQCTSNILCLLFVFYHQRIWTAVTVSVPVVLECFSFVRNRRTASSEKLSS